ncbi:hypothetical protein B4U79_16086 [Dinothrombium tinctorium]|uniref:MICOS complex subunit MIC19 n=1 Tax=Dinothrombium tinctorium TaxID=1965070 RepID=A0A443QSG7_9ACAR|nr:hypothetical protein B4U79_16086 [Dinothrombium tinctorium]
MGGSPSTRRVTVVNDELSNVITVSSSVVKRLQGAEEDDGKKSEQQSKAEAKTAHLSRVSLMSSLFRFASTLKMNFDLLQNHIEGLDSLTVQQQVQREVQRAEKSWKTQISELERQNNQLWDLANKNFESKIKDVENTYISEHKHEPICQEAEKTLDSCYKTNKSKPLNCSAEVKNFVSCVNLVRREVFNSNA